VAGILRADPKAVVAFIQPWIAQWAKLLRARMARLLGADSARVVFVPRQGQDADCMNTSLESFAVGTPVVTLPGQFQRGRHTYGMYRKMGIETCVAKDAEDYTAIAVRLATDPAFRQSVREQILTRNPVLYEDLSVVREFERFFLAASGPELSR